MTLLFVVDIPVKFFSIVLECCAVEYWAGIGTLGFSPNLYGWSSAINSFGEKGVKEEFAGNDKLTFARSLELQQYSSLSFALNS